MKIQMQGQRIRLRVDEAELARLQAGEVVENLTRLPGGIDCRQQLCVTEGPDALLVAVAAGWQFGLPRDLLQAYVARLPCREGLRLHLPLPGGDDIEFGFEVDVRDSVRNRGVKSSGNQARPL
ncbi:MAG: hypothetical protein ABIR05_08880 [Luteimonas sp.]